MVLQLAHQAEATLNGDCTEGERQWYIPSGCYFTPDQVSHRDYDAGNRDGAAAGKKKRKISADYFNSVMGKTETMTMEHDGPDIHYPYIQSRVDAAKHCLKAKKTRTQQKGRKMRLTLSGGPWLILITVECKVETQGFGVPGAHYWLTESVRFSLSNSLLSVAFSLVTNIKGKKER